MHGDLIWSEPARYDLKSIHDFIAHDSKYYAKKVAHDIREKASTLNDFPKSGKKVPEINDDNIRELHLYSYRIIYQIDKSDIHVLAIIHR